MARMTFFDSYYEGIKNCDNATRLEALEAIIEYGLYGTEKEGLSSLAQMIFTLVKPSISKSREQAERSRENGGKGGRPRINDNPDITQNNPEKPKITQTKPRKTLKKNIEVEEEVEVEGEKELGFFGKKPIEEKDAYASQKESVEKIVERWNQLPDCVPKVKAIDMAAERFKMLKERLKTYSLDGILSAIDNIENSPFLLGDNKNRWTIKFDWFVRPNNFPKVYEGQYCDSGVTITTPRVARGISIVDEMIARGELPNDD